MSAQRLGRLQRASALVPLAVLSVAWTASVAGMGATTAAATDEVGPSLPDGTSVPTEAIEAPASVSAPGVVSTGQDPGNAARIVRTSSANGIPSAALAAYQRAETVINSADKSCNLAWQLVAAIGRVESDHGRYGGNTLDDEGVARPGIYGIPLDGRRGTAVIRDTDAGEYDRDAKFDRAIGPMQFIPSTWSVVGVDADGDAQRNPQDIDDAALASAVYLCSGDDDLSTTAGQRSAVFRYNHSQAYVDLVLSIMEAYTAGDFTSVPNSTTAAGYIVPDPDYVATATGPRKGNQVRGEGGGGQSSGGPSGASTTAPAPAPSQPAPTQPAPTQPPAGGGGISLPNPAPSVLPSVTLPALPSTSIKPVDGLLTLTQALVQCTLDGLVDNPLSKTDTFDKCVYDYTH